MKDEELEIVVKSCTRAHINPNLDYLNMVKLLRIAGKQLDKCSGTYHNSARPPFSNGWDLCTNLQEVSLSGNFRREHVLAPYLKKLRLDFSWNTYDERSCSISLKKVMDGIANRRVTALESVSFVCSFPAASAFRKLVAMNKQLSDVEIEIIYKQPIKSILLFKRLTNIVRCYFQSPSLSFLNLNNASYSRQVDSSTIREIIGTEYRYRRVHVSIDGE